MPNSNQPRIRRLLDFRFLGPRTTLIALTIHLLLLVGAMLTIRYSLDQLIVFQDRELLQRRLNHVVDRLQEADDDDTVRVIVSQQRVPTSLHKRVYTLVYDGTGKLFESSASPQAWDEVLPDHLPVPEGNLASEDLHLLPSSTGRVFAYQSAVVKHKQYTWTVVIAADHDVEQAMTNRLVRLIPITVVILVFISLLLSWLLNRAAIAPLRQLTEHVASVRSVAKDPVLIREDLYPIDFQGLVKHSNSMLKRLHGSYTRVASFTSDIAHELRTPLHNLMGEIDVALSKRREAAEYEQILISNREEVERLRSIVGSLLTLSQTGTIEPAQLEAFSLSSELHKIHEYFSPLAEEADITLVIESAPDCTMRAQRTLFQQAVGNLISNAIKFTPKDGTVKIRFSFSVEENQALIQIIDNGPGISESDLPYIFNRFYKVDASRTYRAGGTGLGLAIVKNIIERHRGSVDVTSKIGEGSCFTIRWPLQV